jgi:hypothetical protein
VADLLMGRRPEISPRGLAIDRYAGEGGSGRRWGDLAGARS